jgi:hypothetical protein
MSLIPPGEAKRAMEIIEGAQKVHQAAGGNDAVLYYRRREFRLKSAVEFPYPASSSSQGTPAGIGREGATGSDGPSFEGAGDCCRFNP